MSATRIVIVIIGLVLAVYGLFTILNGGFDSVHLVIGIVLIVVGVYLPSGRGITL